MRATPGSTLAGLKEKGGSLLSDWSMIELQCPHMGKETKPNAHVLMLNWPKWYSAV